MKVIFAGTPDFAVPPLQAIALEHDIVGVFTQPDRKSGRGKKLTPPAVKLAAQKIFAMQDGNAQTHHPQVHKAKVHQPKVHQPSSLKDQADLIESLQPDVMVVVAYGMLLPQAILDIPRLGCINIHASLLPRWRGAAPIHRAIEAGDAETGVAIMRMELGLDTGPVFNVLKTTISDTDTTATLHDKLAELGATGICQTLNHLADDPKLKAVQQDDSQASYAKKIIKSEAAIDWSKTAKEIHQQIRAFVPFPISQCQHQETRLRIWQASVISDSSTSLAAGQVVNVTTKGVDVQCGQGTLRLEILQRDGSKSLPWQQFSNGYQLTTGDTLT